MKLFPETARKLPHVPFHYPLADKGLGQFLKDRAKVVQKTPATG